MVLTYTCTESGWAAVDSAAAVAAVGVSVSADVDVGVDVDVVARPVSAAAAKVCSRMDTSFALRVATKVE